MYHLVLFFILLIVIIFLVSGGTPYVSREIKIPGGINYKGIFENVKNLLNTESLGDNGDIEVLNKNNYSLDLPIGFLEKLGNFQSVLNFSDKYTAVRLYRFNGEYIRDKKIAGNMSIISFNQNIEIYRGNTKYGFKNLDFIVIPQEDTDFRIVAAGGEFVYILELYEPLYTFGFYPYLCHFTEIDDKNAIAENLMVSGLDRRLRGQKIMKKMINNNYLELCADPFSYSTYNWVGKRKHNLAAIGKTTEETVNSICAGETIENIYGYSLFSSGFIDICINMNPRENYDFVAKLKSSGRVRHFATITYTAEGNPIFNTETFTAG